MPVTVGKASTTRAARTTHYMCDEDFKKDMFDEKIAFKSGMR